MNQYRGFEISYIQTFFKQILKSIGFLHKIGYTHTDLKPENILLEKEELKRDTSKEEEFYIPVSKKIRIIDFGGATKYDEYHSAVICTRQYRPPEVIL
jgi:serine/threonine protein kinase